MSSDEKVIYKKKFDCFYKRCDIFALFLENALSLASNKGIVTFIIPSVVHSNLSYQKLRDLILNNHWLNEVCYTGGKVFNVPTVDTTIIRCNKSGCDTIILKNAVDFVHPTTHCVDKNYFKKYQNVISIGADNEDNIIDKMFSEGYVAIDKLYSVFQGIVTGNNSAFIFDTELDALAKGVDKQLLHPLCHGRDVGRYEIKSRKRRILYIDNSISVEDYPKTRKWLLNFKDQLDKRNIGKQDVISWYSLHRPRIKLELDIKEKILVQNTRNESLKQRIVATIDSDGIYATQGVNFVIPKSSEASLYYLLGILNSRLINHLFATKFLNLAIKAEYLKQIKLPRYDEKDISDMVKDILNLKQRNSLADTSIQERAIDNAVYQIYGLTDEEIKIIEGGQ